MTPPEPQWVLHRKPPRQKKKKPALTPKEALRLKVQANAAKQAPRSSRAAGGDEARKPLVPVTSEERETAPKAKVGASPEAKKRAETPAAPQEEPSKPSLWERIVGFFRRSKKKPAKDE